MSPESNVLKKNNKIKNGSLEYDARSVFQSFRFRHSAILADSSDWKLMGRELKFVCYCGVFLWTIHIITILI